MSVGRRDVVKLYRALVRHSKMFADYNFREYALKRTRHGFETLRNESDPQVIKEAYYAGLNSLAMVKRQSTISQMFAAPPVVIEKELGSSHNFSKKK